MFRDWQFQNPKFKPKINALRQGRTKPQRAFQKSVSPDCSPTRQYFQKQTLVDPLLTPYLTSVFDLSILLFGLNVYQNYCYGDSIRIWLRRWAGSSEMFSQAKAKQNPTLETLCLFFVKTFEVGPLYNPSLRVWQKQITSF